MAAKMKKTHLAAIVMLLGVFVWVASSWIIPSSNASKDAADNQSVSKEAKTAESVKALLRVERREAEQHSGVTRIYGQTEPNRTVEIAAETQGKITAIPAEEGMQYKKGDILVEIDQRDRPQRLEQARALVNQRNIEYDAAKKLLAKGFQSEVRVAEQKARLAEAKAELKAIELDLAYTKVRAPFDGTLERIHNEIGDFVGIGVFGAEGALATFVDQDPIIVTGQISEKDRAGITLDSVAQITLNTGETAEGTVRYLGAVADEASRTFRIEVEVPNPELALPSGVTAELRITSAERDAYFISPSILALDDSGKVGVKYLDAERVVHFTPIEILEDTKEGMWVMGIPSPVDLIVGGQNFVSPGQQLDDAVVRDASAD